mmetsp:Transcript_77627/g.195266  ORF Transcript_77627/g.195266 Transcript_77627/m.195266 type:complete len:202 (-) Transcript_77627:1614-2219(-)
MANLLCAGHAASYAFQKTRCTSVKLSIVPFHKRHIVASSELKSTMQAWASTCCPCTTPGACTKTQEAASALHAHFGNGECESNTSAPMMSVSTAPTMMITSVTGKPFRKKSLKRRDRARSCDLARTTTLEGVAVGSKKAKELAIVAGNSSCKGFTTASSDAELITGNKAAAIPMPEKIWTLKVTHATIARLRTKVGKCGTN